MSLFLFIANILLYGYTTLLISGRLSFHFLVIMNNAALNIFVHFFVVMFSFLLGMYLGTELLSLILPPHLTLLKNLPDFLNDTVLGEQMLTS